MKKATAKIKPTGFFCARDFLRKLHGDTKKELGQYSYRQMAEDLGFSATNVIHLYAQGKRGIGEQAGKQIADSLTLRKEQRQYFLKLCKMSQNLSQEDFANTFGEALEIRSSLITDKLDQNHLRYYSHWSNIVIREMVRLPKFKADPKWISQKLWPRVSVKEAQDALNLLEELGFIHKNPENDRWEQQTPTLSTGAEVASLSVSKYHHASIPQGLQSIVEVDQQKRYISALTLCIDEEQFELIKQKIEAFQQQLLELESSSDFGDPDRVVQLNMQLFQNTTD